VALLVRDSGSVQISFNITRVSFEAVMSFAPDLLEFVDSVMYECPQRRDLETPRDHELDSDEQVEGDSVQALDGGTDEMEKHE
jgi:hypothetical protein